MYIIKLVFLLLICLMSIQLIDQLKRPRRVEKTVSSSTTLSSAMKIIFPTLDLGRTSSSGQFTPEGK